MSCDVVSGVSDHDAVTLTCKLSLPHRKQDKCNVHVWSKANLQKIKDALKFSINFTRCCMNLSVVDVLSFLVLSFSWLDSMKSISSNCLRTY